MKAYHGIRLKDPGVLKEGLKLWSPRECKEEVRRAFDYFAKKGYLNPNDPEVKEALDAALLECERRFSTRGIHVTVFEDAACGWALRNPEIAWVHLGFLMKDDEPLIPDEEIHRYLEKRYGKPYCLEIDLDKLVPPEKQKDLMKGGMGGADIFLPIPSGRLDRSVIREIRRC